jgi:hypothetical protein
MDEERLGDAVTERHGEVNQILFSVSPRRPLSVSQSLHPSSSLSNCSAVYDHNLTIHKTIAIANHKGRILR